MFYWSNLNIKDTLARLRRNQNPDNGPVWEVPDDIDDDYLAQMESEQRIKEKGQWMWKQIGSRPNHYFDCESMQAAAATTRLRSTRNRSSYSRPLKISSCAAAT